MRPDRGYWSGRRVCVTGGTGFLGWQIVRQLLDRGAAVNVLALRPDDDHPVRTDRRVAAFYGDVRDEALVRRAAAGCSVIFHTAGVVSCWRRMSGRMWSVNVDGTAAVLAAAPGARLVHTSSITTLGPPRTRIAYVESKRAAEELALRAAAGRRDVVVTNPAYLVGPEDYERSAMGRFCVRFWKGRVPVAPPGGFNLVDVRDAAAGHLLAAERGAAGGRYLLGGEDHSFPSFMRLLALAGRCRPRAVVRLPWVALALMAGLAEFRALFTGKEPYPSFDHARLNRHAWFGSSARAEEELGYRARPVIESLYDAYDWHSARAAIRPRGLSRWWVRPMPLPAKPQAAIT